MLEELGLGFDEGQGEQYVSFTLDDEVYGISIDQVQEILGFQGFTPIPDQPPYMPGVLDLRGAVVPAVDLRLRFGKEAREYDRYTVIMIVSHRNRTLGLIVDAVSDVISISDEDLQPSPNVGRQGRETFIQGMARLGEKFLVLLDVDRIVSGEELDRAEETG